MSTRTNRTAPGRSSRTLEPWARQWQGRWSKAGGTLFELSIVDGADRQHALFGEMRMLEMAIAPLQRIRAGFVHGNRGFHRAGSAATVFESARFGEGRCHFKLARAGGSELARRIQRRYRLPSEMPEVGDRIELQESDHDEHH